MLRRLLMTPTVAIVSAAVGLSARGVAPSQVPVGAGPTGSIRGHVDVRRNVSSAEGRPTVSDLAMPAPHDRADRLVSVVYLESAPANAFDRPAVRARMTQRNETFVPHVLAVQVGTTVDFPNDDHTYHNVFSLSKTQRFDLGRYAAGQSKPIRFDRPGIVRVFCEIHSHMSAFILVFGHRFFDTTDAAGRYEIPAVPPGRYTVIAWNDGAIRDTRAVIVPEQGGPIELDFVLR